MLLFTEDTFHKTGQHCQTFCLFDLPSFGNLMSTQNETTFLAQSKGIDTDRVYFIQENIETDVTFTKIDYETYYMDFKTSFEK